MFTFLSHLSVDTQEWLSGVVFIKSRFSWHLSCCHISSSVCCIYGSIRGCILIQLWSLCYPSTPAPVLPRSPHHLLLTYRRAICDVVEIQPMSFRALLSKDLPQLSFFFKDKPWAKLRWHSWTRKGVTRMWLSRTWLKCLLLCRKIKVIRLPVSVVHCVNICRRRSG